MFLLVDNDQLKGESTAVTAADYTDDMTAVDVTDTIIATDITDAAMESLSLIYTPKPVSIGRQCVCFDSCWLHCCLLAVDVTDAVTAVDVTGALTTADVTYTMTAADVTDTLTAADITGTLTATDVTDT